MGRISKTLGAAGEDQAERSLYRLGIEQIEKIGTPVILIPVSAQFTKMGIFRVRFGEKVAADRRGVAPDGISVLAEVKTCFGRNLQWSDLSPHQPAALSRHAELGGISLLTWVTDNGVHTMHFPIEGFEFGKGLTARRAESFSITSTKQLFGRRKSRSHGSR